MSVEKRTQHGIVWLNMEQSGPGVAGTAAVGQPTLYIFLTDLLINVLVSLRLVRQPGTYYAPL